jgi:hypothetical protein
MRYFALLIFPFLIGLVSCKKDVLQRPSLPERRFVQDNTCLSKTLDDDASQSDVLCALEGFWLLDSIAYRPSQDSVRSRKIIVQFFDGYLYLIDGQSGLTVDHQKIDLQLPTLYSNLGVYVWGYHLNGDIDGIKIEYRDFTISKDNEFNRSGDVYLKSGKLFFRTSPGSEWLTYTFERY